MTRSRFRQAKISALVCAAGLLFGCAQETPCADADNGESPEEEPQITIIKGSVPHRSTLAAGDTARLAFIVEKPFCSASIAEVLVERFEENSPERDTLFWLENINAGSLRRDTSIVARAAANDTLSFVFLLEARAEDGAFSQRRIRYNVAGE